MWPLKPNIRKLESKRDIEGLRKASTCKNPKSFVAALQALERVGARSALKEAAAKRSEAIVESIFSGDDPSSWRTRAPNAKSLLDSMPREARDECIECAISSMCIKHATKFAAAVLTHSFDDIDDRVGNEWAKIVFFVRALLDTEDPSLQVVVQQSVAKGLRDSWELTTKFLPEKLHAKHAKMLLKLANINFPELEIRALARKQEVSE